MRLRRSGMLGTGHPAITHLMSPGAMERLSGGLCLCLGRIQAWGRMTSMFSTGHRWQSRRGHQQAGDEQKLFHR